MRKNTAKIFDTLGCQFYTRKTISKNHKETIELHKEDGWDAATTIEPILMSAGDEKDIVIEEGQCISLIINTEIELIKK